MPVQQKLGVSERRACKILGQYRSVQRRTSNKPQTEQILRADIVRLAGKYGRYGYRRITALVRAEGWIVNHKRVERIWREEGLKVPKKQPKRARLYINDGSCIRDYVPVLRTTYGATTLYTTDYTVVRR